MRYNNCQNNLRSVKMSVPKYPEVEVTLIGQDGNIFGIMGKVSQELKRKLPKPEGSEAAKEFQAEVMESGSYDEALQIVTKYVNVC